MSCCKLFWLLILALFVICLTIFKVVNYDVCIDSKGKPVKPLLGNGKCVWHLGISLLEEKNTLYIFKTKYDGQWYDGKMDGYGVYTTMSGNKYKGQWKENKRHGKGEFTIVDGTIYKGDWVEDKLTCKDGFLSMNRYIDTQFGNVDLYPGASTYLVDHTYYQGGVMDGLMNGDGIITLDAGRQINAHFVAGKPLDGRITLKDGEVVTIRMMNDNWEYGFIYKCTANIMLQDGSLIFVECNLDNFRFELPADVNIGTEEESIEGPKRRNLTDPLLENSLPSHKAEELKNIFSALAWFEFHFVATQRYLLNNIYVFGDDVRQISENEKSKYDL